MADVVISNESAGRRVIGTIVSGAIALVTRRSNHELRGILDDGVLRVAAKYSGSADPRGRGMGGKIAREETIGRKVAVVVAVVVIPDPARRPGGGSRAVLGHRRCRR